VTAAVRGTRQPEAEAEMASEMAAAAVRKEGGYAEGSDGMARMTLRLVVVEDAGGLRRGGMLGPECG